MGSGAASAWGTGRHTGDPGPGRTAWTDLARLVLPVTCAGCGCSDAPLCRSCRLLLPSGGRPVSGLAVGTAPRTWSGADYDGVLRKVVLAFKDDGRHDLAGVLTWSLARCVAAALDDLALDDLALDDLHPGADVVLVPAPSSRRSVRSRGSDLTAGLARGAAAALRRRGRPVSAVRALRQRAGVRDQAGLSAPERLANLSGALGPRPGVRLDGRLVLVVDDVVTTGATLASCAAVLTGVGATVVGAATLAATVRWSAGPFRPFVGVS